MYFMGLVQSLESGLFPSHHGVPVNLLSRHKHPDIIEPGSL